jgi:hypothetical protein
MEPANPGARREEGPLPSADTDLKYALRRLLLTRQEDGFVITPIAKCSLETKYARPTQKERWRLCSPYLIEELRLLKEAGLLRADFVTVTVGNGPDRFLRGARCIREFTPRHLGKLTHYGAYRYGWFKVAEADREAFERFWDDARKSDYRDFVGTYVKWDLPHLDSSLQRHGKILFKWSQQMEGWRARLQ